MYAPFSSKLEWLFARWAKLRGPSQTSLDEFLAIPEVVTFVRELTTQGC